MGGRRWRRHCLNRVRDLWSLRMCACAEGIVILVAGTATIFDQLFRAYGSLFWTRFYINVKYASTAVARMSPQAFEGIVES
jgi:hypothetical protein